MKVERFSTTLTSRHEGLAVEVPFDPTLRWGLPARRLDGGQHGHPVRGRLEGVPLESVVLADARGVFLIVPPTTAEAAGVQVGETVRVSLEPMGVSPGGSNRPAESSRRAARKRPPAVS